MQEIEIVLLTGAGASTIIGLPTLDQLLVRSNIKAKDDKSLEIIKEARKVIASKNYGNAVFEEIIPLLKNYYNTAKLLRSDYLFLREVGELSSNVLNGQFELTWQKALTECFRLLVETYGPQSISSKHDGITATVRLLKSLAKINKGDLHLFTTNYDCAFQVIGKQMKKKINLFTRINNESQKLFDRDNWHLLNKSELISELPSIYIHRLHGCVAWYSNRGSNVEIYEDYGVADHIETDNEDKLNRMEVKLIKSESEGLNPALQIEFNDFSRCLQNTKILLVWGYSFRDQEVLRIINNSLLTKQSSLTVFYLDPYLSENSVLDNIRWTLRNVPISISPHFKPKQIPWKPQHGYDKMVKATVFELNKEIKKNETAR